MKTIIDIVIKSAEKINESVNHTVRFMPQGIMLETYIPSEKEYSYETITAKELINLASYL